MCVNFVARYRIPADALGSSDIGSNSAAAQGDLEAKQLDTSTGKIVDGAQVLEVEKQAAHHSPAARI